LGFVEDDDVFGWGVLAVAVVFEEAGDALDFGFGLALCQKF